MIKAVIGSVNPSIDWRIPSAAITAPPGTPGAATIVTPSMRINGNMCWNPISDPLSIRIDNEQDVSVIVEPDKWIVAQRGITKSAIPLFTPNL